MDNMNQLTFWSEERPAKVSASPDCAAGSKMIVATFPLNIAVWLNGFAPAGWSGRTSPASCHRMEDGILVPSSGRWANSGMGSPTEFLTLSSSEFPSAGDASSLSDILETGDLQPKYFLSPKACAGILRRAAKRGKVLPPQLARALQAAAGLEPTSIAMAA